MELSSSQENTVHFQVQALRRRQSDLGIQLGIEEVVCWIRLTESVASE